MNEEKIIETVADLMTEVLIDMFGITWFYEFINDYFNKEEADFILKYLKFV